MFVHARKNQLHIHYSTAIQYNYTAYVRFAALHFKQFIKPKQTIKGFAIKCSFEFNVNCIKFKEVSD